MAVREIILMGYTKKYRPDTFEKVIGNKSQVAALEKSVKRETPIQAYIIVGPHGVGKTTLARVACKALNIDPFNITEMNLAQDGLKKDSEEITSACGTVSMGNRGWILDEMQASSKAFQNGILKILEEPPETDYFFICTTDPAKILDTVVSRCTPIKLNLVKDSQIKKLLKGICREENYLLDPEILEMISEAADGHVRDAVKLLDTVSGMEEEYIQEYLESNVAGLSEDIPEVINFCRIYFSRIHFSDNIGKVLKNLGALKKERVEPETVRRTLLSYGSSVMLRDSSRAADIAEMMEWFEEPLFDTGTAWPLLITRTVRSLAD